jgi:hypothetical protein
MTVFQLCSLAQEYDSEGTSKLLWPDLCYCTQSAGDPRKSTKIQCVRRESGQERLKATVLIAQGRVGEPRLFQSQSNAEHYLETMHFLRHGYDSYLPTRKDRKCANSREERELLVIL